MTHSAAATATRTDVLVVGGGPAGVATALAVRRVGLSALVVEPADYGTRRDCDTLSPAARRLLERLGIAEGDWAQCGARSQGIRSAWGSPRPAERNFLFDRDGAGVHVDRARFDAMLARLAERSGVALRRRARIAALARAGGAWRASVECAGASGTVTARYVVDATGRAARIARRLGATRLVYDRLLGVSAFVAARPEAGSMLLLEAARDGWWYALPASEGRLLACYLTDADLLPRGAGLERVWSEAFGRTRLARGAAMPAGSSAVFVRAAAVGRLDRLSGEGWLAVGDAAASFDPLSGAGLFHALRSALAAARAIAADAAGESGALAQFAHAQRAVFARHLRERASHYTLAGRRSSLFWRRRRPIDPTGLAMRLDPLARLGPGPVAGDAHAGARLEGVLARQDIACLRRLCDEPTEAHRVVSGFRELRASDAGDLDAIAALQVLIEDRALAVR